MKYVGLFAIISLVCTGLGIAFFFLGLGETQGAPQKTALATMVLAGVIPPYLFARAYEMNAKDDVRRDQAKQANIETEEA